MCLKCEFKIFIFNQDQKETCNILRKIVKERMNAPERHSKDLLDQAINDMDKEKFLSEDLIVQLMYSLLFASFESISSTLSLTLKLLADHPAVLQELKVRKCATTFLACNLCYVYGNGVK